MIAIIGAGPSGITAAKTAIQAGLTVTVFEKNSKVGGNWVFNDTTGHSSVYENTHLISSKTLSSYEDFPMPDHYPDYPNHRLVQAYFEEYAHHFGVIEHIRFGHTVLKAEPGPGGAWTLTYTGPDGGGTQTFTHLMVANGHHWHPRWPSVPGTFTGKLLHSHDVKRIDDSWRGKRVVVIGAGNSAADLAVETARIAETVYLSLRSAQWFIPKYLFGMPSDVLALRSRWLPRRLRQHALSLLLRIVQGDYAEMGLPRNARPVLSHHPTVNSDLLDLVRHRRVIPKPGLERYEGEEVVFADGSRERVDVVIAATGFQVRFPFFGERFSDWADATSIPLYRKMMHPDHPTLYFIGLFQPLGCIWPLADWQARIAVAEIQGRYARPADLKAAIARELANPHYDFDSAPRHAVEVDYHRFRDELVKELGHD